MAQCYFKDTGLLVDQGDTEANYQAAGWYDSQIHATCNESFSFPADWRDMPWFYVPSTNSFYRYRDGLHPILQAAETQFTGPEWTDMTNKLDEIGGFCDCLNRMDITRFQAKIVYAESSARISSADATKLNSVIAHLVN